MMITSFVKTVAVSAAIALGSVGAVSAATVDFDGSPNGVSTSLVSDGFSFDVARIVNGNCAALDCLALNPDRGQSAADYSVMTSVLGGAFNLVSAYLYLAGTDSNLVVTGYDAMGDALNTMTYTSPPFPQNLGGILNFGGLFDNVFAVSFTNTGTGNVRVDDINTSTIATVPVPGALGLMAMALGGLGLVRRRKSNAV